MNSYFDASALVKRYVTEKGSVWVKAYCNKPNQIMAIADIGRAEVAAAFASKLRGRIITQTDYHQARTDLTKDVRRHYNILPVTSARVDEAIDLTARYKLRGYDAVHLACALNFNQFVTTNGYLPITFISADNDLLQVAQAEGLLIENPNLYP
jgi:predicted nucleic acid-binding protein